MQQQVLGIHFPSGSRIGSVTRWEPMMPWTNVPGLILAELMPDMVGVRVLPVQDYIVVTNLVGNCRSGEISGSRLSEIEQAIRQDDSLTITVEA